MAKDKKAAHKAAGGTPGKNKRPAAKAVQAKTKRPAILAKHRNGMKTTNLAPKAAPMRAIAAKVATAKPAQPMRPAAANANAKFVPSKGMPPRMPGKPGQMRPGMPGGFRPVLAPRAPYTGKEPEFSAGDYVVYPTHGVGRIQGVEHQEIAGTSLKVIVITFEKERMTLRVPVGKATNSGLRRLSSRKEMETALKTLKGRSRIRRMMWSRRAQEYEAKINSGDPVSIAEVVRDLYRNAGQPDQSYSERQIYQAALDRLARELAAVEKIDEMAAAQKLESVLRAA
jgi:CarD family transcriptional regulator